MDGSTMEENDGEEDEEKDSRGLKFAPWVGTGFGLVAAGYLAKYFLGMFSGMKGTISPSIGNIFVSLGIIVLLVALTAEIFTEFKKVDWNF